MDGDDKDIMRLRKRKQRTKHIVLEWDTYKYWHKFGLDHGMVTDSEVAVFLLQFYRSVKPLTSPLSRCIRCDSPLTQYCTICHYAPAPKANSVNVHATSHCETQVSLPLNSLPQATLCAEADITLRAKPPEAPKPDHSCVPNSDMNSDTCKPVVVLSAVGQTACPSSPESSQNSRITHPFAIVSSDLTTLSENLQNKSTSVTNPDTKCSFELSSPQPKFLQKTKPTKPSSSSRINLQHPSSKRMKKNPTVIVKSIQKKVQTCPIPVQFCSVQVSTATTTHSQKEAALVYDSHLFDIHRDADDANKCEVEIKSETDHSVEQKLELKSEHIRENFAIEEDDKHCQPIVMKQPKSKRMYTCQLCLAAFSFKSRLTRHMTTHTGKKPYKCLECGAVFTRSLTLKDHMAMTHSGSNNFKCQECNASFSKSNSLTLHMQHCHVNKKLKCDQCDAAFSRVCDLKVHMRKHVPPTDKPYVCQVCGQSYTAACNLTIHMRKHTGVRPYLCQECGASFLSSSNLQGHMLRHSGSKRFFCKECSAAFSKLYDLKVHLRTHTGERPYQCHHCGKSFSTSSSLARHTQGHTGGKNFKCSECDATFAYSSTLKIHMRKHTGDMHKCSDCGKGFLERRSLIVHVRTHTGERPFQCGYCNLSFRNPNSLKQHLPVHTGQKPYRCNECGKAFALSSKLARHMKKHYTDKPYVTKPYSCVHCGSAFTQPSTLATHVRRKHTAIIAEENAQNSRLLQDSKIFLDENLAI